MSVRTGRTGGLRQGTAHDRRGADASAAPAAGVLDLCRTGGCSAAGAAGGDSTHTYILLDFTNVYNYNYMKYINEIIQLHKIKLYNYLAH